jgi:uncharacterized protein
MEFRRMLTLQDFAVPLAIAGVVAVTACDGQQRSAPVTLRFVNPVTTAPVPPLVRLFDDLEKDTGIRIDAGGRNGSTEVVSALQNGTVDLGLAQADVVYQAFRRGLEPGSGAFQNLRGVAVGGAARLVIFVRRDSDIFAIPDLRGRRIAVPTTTSSADLLTRRMLELSGLTYADLDVRVHQPREMSRFLESEQLEGMILNTISDPETLLPPGRSGEFRLVPIPRHIISQLRAEYPFLRTTAITWRNGDSSPEQVPTAGVDFVILANIGVPDEVIYRLTAGILTAVPSNNPFEIDVDLAPATPIPLHPGAARYYREVQLLK